MSVFATPLLKSYDLASGDKKNSLNIKILITNILARLL